MNERDKFMSIPLHDDLKFYFASRTRLKKILETLASLADMRNLKIVTYEHTGISTPVFSFNKHTEFRNVRPLESLIK